MHRIRLSLCLYLAMLPAAIAGVSGTAAEACPTPCITEYAIPENHFDCTLGLFDAVRDDDTFSGSESRRFDDDRSADLTHSALRGFDRSVQRRGCSGNARAAHYRFRKCFRRFDSCRRSSGSKNLSTVLAKEIDDSDLQRRLWSDDGQINVGALGERREPSDIRGFDWNAIADLGDSGIARSADQFNRWIICEEFPGERVFASATAHEQNLHC